MKRILVTGAGGRVGSNLVHTMGRRLPVSGTFHRLRYRPPGLPTYHMDLASKKSIADVFSDARPDVVIHAAALTQLDWCETHVAETRAANVDGTRQLVEVAREFEARVVLISTDMVFDGGSPPYREGDRTGPVNVYALSKLDSEPLVRALPDSLIVRTTVFGWNVRPHPDIAERTVDSLERSLEVVAFDDLFSSPVLVNDLAEILAEMIERDLVGLYHVCGKDTVSKFQLSRLVAGAFGLDGSLIRPGDSRRASLAARRPRDTTLDVTKIEATLGRPMPTLAEGIRRFRGLHDEGYRELLRQGADLSSAV